MTKHILIIDDDDAIRMLIAAVLARNGYTTAHAANGLEGLREARTRRPDLIILDLMLPRMTGWEFRATQKQDDRLAGIPVIIISAGSPEKTGVLGDVAARLSKPFDFETFLWLVDQCLKDDGARLTG